LIVDKLSQIDAGVNMCGYISIETGTVFSISISISLVTVSVLVMIVVWKRVLGGIA
jgi:hypothetical protein